jgi:hypothetical protein
MDCAAAGVGQFSQEEKALSQMRRANFLRCKDSRLNAITVFFQVAFDPRESADKET